MNLDKINKIVQRAIRALNDPTAKATKQQFEDLEIIPVKIVNKIKSEFGIDLSGYVRVIGIDEVIHALKQHGIDSKDRYPIDNSDFLLIPFIVNEPDKIKKGGLSRRNNSQTLIYEKNIGDKYYYVEEIRKGRKKVALLTFYKRKNPLK